MYTIKVKQLGYQIFFFNFKFISIKGAYLPELYVDLKPNKTYFFMASKPINIPWIRTGSLSYFGPSGLSKLV